MNRFNKVRESMTLFLTEMYFGNLYHVTTPVTLPRIFSGDRLIGQPAILDDGSIGPPGLISFTTDSTYWIGSNSEMARLILSGDRLNTRYRLQSIKRQKWGEGVPLYHESEIYAQGPIMNLHKYLLGVEIHDRHPENDSVLYQKIRQMSPVPVRFITPTDIRQDWNRPVASKQDYMWRKAL